MQQQFSENLFCEVNNISDNWVVSNLENALSTWNKKLAELWQLITQTPQSFKGGQIWSVIVSINSALQGIGYGLLVLFFAMGVFGAATDRRELANLLHISDNVRHPGRCDGQSGYGVKIVDNIVERVIMHQFSKIKAADSAAIIQQTHEARVWCSCFMKCCYRISKRKCKGGNLAVGRVLSYCKALIYGLSKFPKYETTRKCNSFAYQRYHKMAPSPAMRSVRRAAGCLASITQATSVPCTTKEGIFWIHVTASI